MAGLLGDEYMPSPVSQGLLQFGAALMTPRELGGGIGPGLLAFNQGAMQAQQMRRQMAQDALREKLYGAQITNYESEAEARKAAAEEKRRATALAEAQAAAQRAVLDSFVPQPMGFRDANIAAGGTPPAGYVPPQQGAPRVTPEMAARWVAAGGSLEVLQKLAESPNFGRPEVARVLERRAADGTPEQIRESKYGDLIGAAVPKPFEMKMQDIGGSVVPVNPYAPTALGKTQSPDSAASNAVAWANNAISQQRLQMDRETTQAGKWTNDLERGLQVNTATGETRPITQGGTPVGPRQKDLTDAQGKALLFGSRARDANSTLEQLAGAGVTMPGMIKQGIESLPLVGNTMGMGVNALPGFLGGPSGPQQQVEQAQRDFINAVLRRESGAVIADTEFANARKQYFPQPGDSAAVIEQKKRNRDLAVQGILAEVPASTRGSVGGATTGGASGGWSIKQVP